MQTAWLGVYQTLLWYEPVGCCGYAALPHIIDANCLRPPSGRLAWTKPNAWQRNAARVEMYLAQELACGPSAVRRLVGQLYSLPGYQGVQYNNLVGLAFPALVAHILKTMGNPDVAYLLEEDARNVYPGIEFPGRSGTPRVDILVSRDGIPRAVISAKWSVRHDRVSDITNECPVYKAAHSRVHRGRWPLHYCVITNEFSPARLAKMLGDSCLDALVHVRRELVTEVCGFDGRLNGLVDLADLVAGSADW